MEIIEIGENLFTFQFFNWKDMERVLQGEPWWFNKKILVLYELRGEEQPSTLKTSNTPIWARVYDIPFNLRTEAVVKKIGNVISKFMVWENHGDDKWGRFIRVLLDLENPLKRGTTLKGKDGVIFRVLLNSKDSWTFAMVLAK